LVFRLLFIPFLGKKLSEGLWGAWCCARRIRELDYVMANRREWELKGKDAVAGYISKLERQMKSED
jgi:hypothetical protein